TDSATCPIAFPSPAPARSADRAPGVTPATIAGAGGTRANRRRQRRRRRRLTHGPPRRHPQMRTANRLYPRELDQGVVWIDNPKLVYLGMQDQCYTFNMFDAQVWVARDVGLGRSALPDTDAMRACSEAWFARENVCAGSDDDIDLQAAYVRDLVDRTDYPEFAIEKVAEMLKEWQRDKQAGILDYRD